MADTWVDIADKITGAIITAADWNQIWANLRLLGGNGVSQPSSDIESLVSASVAVGASLPFNAASVPSGYLAEDGSAVSRTTYSALFAIIGTTYGVGDGSTTFNVPDSEGLAKRGTGSHGTETMADGNPYAGPALGAYDDDQMQQITAEWDEDHNGYSGNYDADDYTGAIDGTIGSKAGQGGTNGNNIIKNFDSANSTAQGGARTGDETRGASIATKWIIKY